MAFSTTVRRATCGTTVGGKANTVIISSYTVLVSSIPFPVPTEGQGRLATDSLTCTESGHFTDDNRLRKVPSGVAMGYLSLWKTVDGWKQMITDTLC